MKRYNVGTREQKALGTRRRRLAWMPWFPVFVSPGLQKETSIATCQAHVDFIYYARHRTEVLNSVHVRRALYATSTIDLQTFLLFAYIYILSTLSIAFKDYLYHVSFHVTCSNGLECGVLGKHVGLRVEVTCLLLPSF
jgi:hypothetical protein